MLSYLMLMILLGVLLWSLYEERTISYKPLLVWGFFFGLSLVAIFKN